MRLSGPASAVVTILVREEERSQDHETTEGLKKTTGLRDHGLRDDGESRIVNRWSDEKAAADDRGYNDWSCVSDRHRLLFAG